jgi:hypothetical protein
VYIVQGKNVAIVFIILAYSIHVKLVEKGYTRPVAPIMR